MKRNILILAFLIIFSSCKNNDIESFRETEKLEEAKKQMIASIADIKLKLGETNNTLSFGVSNEQGLNLRPNFFEAKNLENGDILKNKVDSIISLAKFDFDQTEPEAVRIRLGFFTSEKINNLFNSEFINSKNPIEAIINKVYFKDGEEKEFTDLTLKKGEGISVNKQVERIDATLSFVIPKSKKYVINKTKKKYDINNDSLTIQLFKNNSFSFTTSAETSNKIQRVEGVYEDGKLLNPNGKSKNQISSAQMIEFYKKLLDWQVNAVKQIENGRFKNVKEIKESFNNSNIKAPKEQTPLVFSKYVFAANIEIINLFIQEGKERYTKRIQFQNRY